MLNTTIDGDGAINYKKMAYHYYLIDKGARIPDTTMTADDKEHLYVAFRFSVSYARGIDYATPRLNYTRTGTKGDEVDKTYFDKNKIDKQDPIHKFVSDKGVIYQNGLEQYVVIELMMQYEPTFRITKSVVPNKALQFKIETAPMVASTRYTNLPDNFSPFEGDGGSLH
jgi:hypothetical protein